MPVGEDNSGFHHCEVEVWISYVRATREVWRFGLDGVGRESTREELMIVLEGFYLLILVDPSR